MWVIREGGGRVVTFDGNAHILAINNVIHVQNYTRFVQIPRLVKIIHTN